MAIGLYQGAADDRFAEMAGRKVPLSALFVSVLALGIASFVNLFWIDVLPDYFALLWVLALIPPFLLAYYRGWEGAALALAAGMVLLVGVEVGGSYLSDRTVRWWILGVFIVVLILVSLGAGMSSDRFRQREKSALDMAYTDALTQLPNRRILDMFLAKEFAASQRGSELSVVMTDIDNFKRYNDTHGHSAGDDALRAVAAVLAQNTRSMNVSGRQGGDEFLTLLTGEGISGAQCFAERVRAGVSETEFGRAHDLSVSLGVASYEPDMEDHTTLVEAADQALLMAKSMGGDVVVVSGEHSSASDDAENSEPAMEAESPGDEEGQEK
jgi:diguanylate cyclase (GGDEF)-like protein